eukprot:721304-Amphidinium_carterae.1
MLLSAHDASVYMTCACSPIHPCATKPHVRQVEEPAKQTERTNYLQSWAIAAMVVACIRACISAVAKEDLRRSIVHEVRPRLVLVNQEALSFCAMDSSVIMANCAPADAFLLHCQVYAVASAILLALQSPSAESAA